MYNMIVGVELFSALWKELQETAFLSFRGHFSIEKYILRKEVNVRWQKSI